MVTTQDVSFGVLWAKLVGGDARWSPGEDDERPLEAPADSATIGLGLVAVWVAGEGPVLVCHPLKGMKVLRTFSGSAPAPALRDALREAGAVVREDSVPPDFD